MPPSADALPTSDDRRVALVTGAGRGIGRGVALRLSREGYRVALTARSEDELRATADECPGRTMVLPADLLDAAAPDAVVDAVEAEWGAPSVLVANAGEGLSSPIGRYPDEMWERQLALNLTAPFRCVRRTAPAMVDAGWGRLVVVASMAAKKGEPYIAGYPAAKHGVLGLVRSVAAELARTGVTANAVCPAYVDTAMTDGTVATIVAQTGRSAEDARTILERKQPIGRLVTVDEVVEAVWFCVVNGAFTGQGLNVDGGAVQG